ncbi:hypothetical protein KAFR_0A05850 [Kazachstania africana CBS 2517]|uniref:C2H2-type domain-containing protein n=1 Tax=Kazachstania africana (strain ATCC 22294 / BCRC 22015 / CBS 2517 / CECT 1963 / NBRC 1671 / NRRL Y-8276) TaxID=1071382 RepID=H2ANS0_KAZAF|nr:hypothetical protein KAFR_0A05850 [Kazachstania africana CBS 2517]CCF56020.1 hypothetical protein KAFR_0A05850 [Kazachstania africana CBS 2517]
MNMAVSNSNTASNTSNTTSMAASSTSTAINNTSRNNSNYNDAFSSATPSIFINNQVFAARNNFNDHDNTYSNPPSMSISPTNTINNNIHKQFSNNSNNNNNNNHPGSLLSTSPSNISNATKLRRDSIAHSQGMGGVSWGSLTIGSWLKDEVMFNSNNNNNNGNNINSISNNYNSNGNITYRRLSTINNLRTISSTSPHSAYLPNLEEQYCKDYSCCGLSLPGLHDLLKHYEEAHINNNNNIITGNNQLINPTTNSHSNDLFSKNQKQIRNAKPYPTTTTTNITTTVPSSSTSSTIMEKHIIQQQLKPSQLNHSSTLHHNNNDNNSKTKQTANTNSIFLNGNVVDAVSTNDVFFPVNSNVKIPTTTNKMYYSFKPQSQTNSNKTINLDFMNDGDLSKLSPFHHTRPIEESEVSVSDSEESEMDDDDEDDEVTTSTSATTPITNSNNNNMHNTSSHSMDTIFKKTDNYIDDPARRLYVMDHEEHKPFKCPVIGCEKTYKNQNGLKYHRIHGHQNQKLHENPDGTFSILDPDSNEPYPDGMGYEKDKPYRCEVCGKRYKNLNGLKYHRGHSTH